MAIRMRNNNDKDSICCECGQTRKKVLDMFDLNIGGEIFTICDLCNDALFYKTLRANCYTNGRVKQKEDIHIINQRGRDLNRLKEAEEKLKTDKMKYDKEEVEEIKRKSSFLGEEDDD